MKTCPDGKRRKRCPPGGRDMGTFLRMPPVLPKKESPVVDDTRTPDASSDMGKVAFDEGVKLAISAALKARAATAAKARLSSLKDVLDTPLSRGAKQVANESYERLARKLPVFEGGFKTQHSMRKEIARHAAANAGTVIKSPASQATQVARAGAMPANDATKVVAKPPALPKARVPKPRRAARGGMAAPIFAAGAAGGVMGSVGEGRADAQA